MTGHKDYYELLGVNPHADRRAIAEAYDRLARRYQPDEDSLPSDPERMRELDEAFDTLDDPERRAEYDRLGAQPAVAVEAGPEVETGAGAAVETRPRRNWLALGLLAAGVAAFSAGLAILALVFFTGDGQRTVTLASGLIYTEVAEGSGEPPRPGDALTVHYTGSLQDGTEFDSSRGGNPFVFFLGTGDVIPGWDEGLASIKKGGRRTLTIPPALAYGDQGAGGVIPPGATLLFDVEVLKIETTGQEITTGSGLKYVDMEVGRDPQNFQAITPATGDEVVVAFVGETAAGTRFTDTRDDEQPYAFIMGSGSETAGFDEGVSTMRVGGSRRLIVPPELGYGAQDAGVAPEGVPSGATLIFDVQLLAIR